MTVTALDILIGAHFAMAFDRRGCARKVGSRAAHCRRLMENIVGAHGHSPPGGNVITFSVESRRLQAQYTELERIVHLHCGFCGAFRDGLCPGIR